MRVSTLRSTTYADDDDTSDRELDFYPSTTLPPQRPTCSSTAAKTTTATTNTDHSTPAPTPIPTPALTRRGRAKRARSPEPPDDEPAVEDLPSTTSSPSPDSNRRTRRLSVIPTSTMPPLTHPDPEDSAVHTIGLSQSARPGSQALSFDSEQLVRMREGHFFRPRPERKTNIQRNWRLLSLSEAIWTRLEEVGCVAKGHAWTAREGCDDDGKYVKPKLPYVMLTKLVIASSPRKMLTLNQIYQAMEERWPYFRSLGQTFRNSIRHNLSMNPAFVNVERATGDRTGMGGKGGHWRVSEDTTSSHRGRSKKARVEKPAPKSKKPVSKKALTGRGSAQPVAIAPRTRNRRKNADNAPQQMHPPITVPSQDMGYAQPKPFPPGPSGPHRSPHHHPAMVGPPPGPPLNHFTVPSHFPPHPVPQFAASPVHSAEYALPPSAYRRVVPDAQIGRNGERTMSPNYASNGSLHSGNASQHYQAVYPGYNRALAPHPDLSPPSNSRLSTHSTPSVVDPRLEHVTLWGDSQISTPPYDDEAMYLRRFDISRKPLSSSGLAQLHKFGTNGNAMGLPGVATILHKPMASPFSPDSGSAALTPSSTNVSAPSPPRCV